MKKQSVSTINLYSLTDIHNKKKTMRVLKDALISLGLKYVPDEKDKNKQ